MPDGIPWALKPNIWFVKKVQELLSSAKQVIQRYVKSLESEVETLDKENEKFW